MPKLHELRQQRNTLANEMRSLHENIGENEWSSEQRGKWKEMKSSIDALEDQIQREEELRDLDQRFVDDNEQEHREQAGGKEKKPEERQAEAFEAFMRGGLGELDAEQRALIKEMRAQGTSPDEKGGFTVPREFQARVFEKMKAFGGLANIAQVITTSHGRDMDWATSDGTAEEGELIGENKAASEQDISYGSATLGAKKLSSKIIRVSNELLQDSGIDITGHVTGRIASRLGRGEAKYLVKGTGTGTPTQPKGLAASVTGTIDTANASKINWKELNALKHAVDPAYRNNSCRWLFNDGTFQHVSELEDAQGRPLWLPGLDRSAPATFLGFQYQIDQAVADMAAGNKFAYFGDFNRFIVRRVAGMTLKRLVERYAEYDQTAFLTFMRFDCLLEDDEAIKALVGKPGSGESK